MTVLGMNLSDGGHLTHGHPLSFSGQDYNIISYNVNPETGLIDYAEMRKLIFEHKPNMVIAGASAYPRAIDFKAIKEIIDDYNHQTKLSILKDRELVDEDIPSLVDEAHCYFMVDMAHIAGLVATGLHQNPCDYAENPDKIVNQMLENDRQCQLLKLCIKFQILLKYFIHQTNPLIMLALIPNLLVTSYLYQQRCKDTCQILFQLNDSPQELSL